MVLYAALKAPRRCFDYEMRDGRRWLWCGEADGSDDETVSVSTYQAGDSIWAKSDGSEVESDADDARAAVAADDAQPKETHRTSRSKR